MIRTSLVTSATGYPVELDNIKTHLRLDLGYTVEDDYLMTLRSAAISKVESITNRKMMKQTHKAYFNDWSAGDYMELPYAPLISIPSSGVTYKNSTGNTTTFVSSEWEADIRSIPGRLALSSTANTDWPTATLHDVNPISIEFTCGYSTVASGVPARLKQAVLMLISHWYEFREPYIVGGQFNLSVARVPDAVNSLISDYRVFKF